MNLLIRYSLFSKTHEFKRTVLKKMKKNWPIEGMGTQAISLDMNQACLNTLSETVSIESLRKDLTAQQIPDVLDSGDLLHNMVCDSMYKWLDAHLIQYILCGDTIICSNVDEINFLLNCYRKVLTTIYKKYGHEAAKYLLKYDVFYPNVLSRQHPNKTYNVVRDIINGEREVDAEEYKRIVNEEALTDINETVTLESVKARSLKGYNSIKSRKKILKIYLKHSFFNNNSKALLNHLKSTNYRDVVEMHINDIMREVNNLALCNNIHFVYKNGIVVDIGTVSKKDKERAMAMAVLQKNTIQSLRKMDSVKSERNKNLSYNPSRVINIVKLKNSIDKNYYKDSNNGN